MPVHSTSPHADFVNITCDPDAFMVVLRELSTLYQPCFGVGFIEGKNYLPGGGTLNVSSNHRWGRFSFSGGCLAAFRSFGVFDKVFGIFAGVPHRVTTLHAAFDVLAPAPPVVARCIKLGRAGRVQFPGRRSIPPERILVIERLAFYCLEPTPTGTVYLGKSGPGVSLKVYDKRNERIDKGLADPGDWVRFELQLGRHVGVTLRDCCDPSGVFWHHMRGTGLLSLPAGVPKWHPNAEGLVLAPAAPAAPMELLARLLDSPDVRALQRVADRMGPKGQQLVYRKLFPDHPFDFVGQVEL